MAGHGSGLVYITGASSGIGQALAWHYYQLGWSVALVARRTAVMEQWAQSMRMDASRYAVYGADVTNIASACSAADACLERQGLPDVVIANAGVSWGVDTSLREDLEVMQQVLASNTMGLAASFQPFIAPWCDAAPGVWWVFAVWPVFAACPAMPHIRPVKRQPLLTVRVCALSCRNPGSL